MYYKLRDIGFFQDENILNNILDIMKKNIIIIKSYTNLKNLKCYDGVPEKFKIEFEKNIEELIKVQENTLIHDKIMLDDKKEWLQFIIKEVYQKNADMFKQNKAFLIYIDIDSLLEIIYEEKNEIIEDFREFTNEIGRNTIFENDKKVVKIMITRIKEHIKTSKKSKIKNLQLNWLISNLKSYAGIGNDEVLD